MDSFQKLARLRPYGAVRAPCKARSGQGWRTIAGSPPKIGSKRARRRLGINRLLCMFNGFAIAKPFCRTDQGILQMGDRSA